jgi:hypothetical protein
MNLLSVKYPLVKGPKESMNGNALKWCGAGAVGHQYGNSILEITINTVGIVNI